MTANLLRWILLSGFLSCYGCFGPGAVSSYYTLNPPNLEASPAESDGASRLVIGLGPLSLPDYLDRPNIVTRTGPNRLEVNDGRRWAGTLQSEVLRALAANLEAMTGAEQVILFPWDVDVEPDLRFRIRIQTFEGKLGDRVRLQADWSMAPGDPDQPVVRRIAQIEEGVRGDDYEALTMAMGRALTLLSRQMAEAVSMAATVHQ